jgi:hypothetical protein
MERPTVLLVSSILMTCLISSPIVKGEEGFHIQKCSSGVEYPTKGDEAVNVEYGDSGYHVRILHPNLAPGPHFSTPVFWVSRGGETDFERQFIAVPTSVGGLTWNSINGYFFAEKQGGLRGFFLEDGFENSDFGSSGLLFLCDGDECSAWKWSYLRNAGEKKGRFQVTNAADPSKLAPDKILKRLGTVLKYAETEADAWPGP